MNMEVCYLFTVEPVKNNHHWAEKFWLHYGGGLNVQILEVWLEKDSFPEGQNT